MWHNVCVPVDTMQTCTFLFICTKHNGQRYFAINPDQYLTSWLVSVRTVTFAYARFLWLTEMVPFGRYRLVATSAL